MPQNVGTDSSANPIFEEYSVPKALCSMILPTIVSQLILVVYNLADTWYVGRTGNADAVAAISLCLPVYTILSAISNLFGIGGASAIARAFGRGETERAKQAFAISAYGALASAVLFSTMVFCFAQPLLLLIGGDAGDIGYAVDYIRWTTVFGGIPTILGPTFAHMIRAAGSPKTASFGMMLGAILNIALDPLFMFVLLKPGMEVTGAAIATMLSNTVALAYFVVYMLRSSESGVYSVRIPRNRQNKRVLADILRSGIPAFCMQALAMFSNCFLNSMLSTLGSKAVAGIGIVRKIDQLAFAVNQGITQGMLPLVAYYYAAGRHVRMKQVILYCGVGTFVFSLACTCVSLLFASELVAVFIQDADTIRYGAMFLRVICLCIPVYSITFVIITVFQALGRGWQPFVLSFLHKGTLDILLMFAIRPLLGVTNIPLSAPISDAVALLVGVGMLIRLLHGLPSGDAAGSAPKLPPEST